MRVLILNGPNLNLLGQRQPELYGSQNYADLCAYLEKEADSLGLDIILKQSNHEGALIDWIQAAKADEIDAIVINPAAYTHTSVALLDALLAVGLPAVEVHLTDPDQREDFRKISYVREACEATFKGYGFASYGHALKHLSKR